MSLTPTPPPQHKAGDSFSRSLEIPADFANGYFTGWTVKSQVRTPAGLLVADVVCDWLDPATTRHLLLTVANTAAWKPGTVEMDVQFTRTADAFVMSTTTASFMVTKDVTA